VRLHAIFTQPGVRRHIFDGQIIPPEQTADIVSRSVALFREHGFGLWMATLRPSIPSPSSPPSPPSHAPSAPSIGFCGFWYFRDPPDLELLYGVADEEIGRGYGREIANAMVAYGFETLRLPVIRASCDAAHTVSRRLLEAIGFTLDRRATVAGLDTVFFERRPGSGRSLLPAHE